jgi:cytochrome c553
MLCPIGVEAEPNAAPAVATVCAPCHGLDGIGHDVEVPNIAGQHSVYLRGQLLAFKSGRRKHPEMYFVGRHLTDREIDELVIYYSTLLSP